MAAVGGVSMLMQAQVPAESKTDDRAKLIAEGEHLVRITGCGDCHTALDEKGQRVKGMEFAGHPAGAPLPVWRPEMLRENILATFAPTGTAYAGPWGVSVAGNLTPDEETGIGRLTADELIKSWRTGKHWKFDNRPVMPPMPMEAYVHLTDREIRAIHAYLFTLKPIRNPVPPSVVAAHPKQP